MVSEWGQYSLGELCEFRGGAVFKPHLQGNVSGEIPFVKVSDMNLPSNSVRILEANNWVSRSQLKELKAKPLPPGAVVFAKIGEALRQNRLRQIVRDTIVDNNMMGAVPREEKVDPRFFYYALSKFDFSHIAQGTALPYLTITSLSALSLEVPALSEQRAIAHILGTLDDKIELNRRINETLEAITRAIFKSWFVDFDSVRAKASGEAPESICRRLGLTPDLLALFPDRLVDSELGEIPEGWEATKVEVVTSKIFSGGTPDTRKAEYWGGELNWCSSGETRNRFIIETEKKITQSGVDNSSTKAVVPGDILIASAGQGHTRGQTSYCAIDTFINQSVVSVRTNTEKAQPHWLFYNLASRYEEMRGLSDSHSSRGSLTTKLLGGMSLILPPIKLVKAFDDIVGPLADQQIKGTQQSITLAAIRDTLLPKLLSGELRVPVEGAA